MKRKIFDCTTFFNSNHLFEIRFNVLKDIVDYFVICESNTTHTGKKRDLILILIIGKNTRTKLYTLKLKIYQK